MEFMKIVLFSVAAAIGYGIVHDQITAHLCVEYFTIAHPPVFSTQSPFFLAIGWGIIATWWVGLALGLALAGAARLGPRHKFALADVRPLVFRLLVFMAACAVLAGVANALLLSIGVVRFPAFWAQRISPERHVAFWADLWAHNASYLSGAVGGMIVVFFVLRRRIAAGRTLVPRTSEETNSGSVSDVR